MFVKERSLYAVSLASHHSDIFKLFNLRLECSLSDWISPLTNPYKPHNLPTLFLESGPRKHKDPEI